MRGLGVRIATWAAAFAAGAVYGTAGTVAHAFAPLGIPVGVVLAAIGLAALLSAVRLLVDGRATTLATGLGVVAAVLVFAGTGPGGSVLVAPDAVGTAWVVAAPALVVVAVAWPDLSRLRRAPAGRPSEAAR